MSTITRFEEREAWHTTRHLSNLAYDILFPIHRPSSIVHRPTCQRSEGSAGEGRAQAYIALDRGDISQSQFDELFILAEKRSRQLSRFMIYLEMGMK